MSMRRLSARKLFQVPPKDLWELLTGEFILVFDDGEIVTDVGQTIFSAYMWEEFAKHPELPFLKRYHLSDVLGGTKRTSVASARELMTRVMCDIYDWHVHRIDPRDDDAKSRVPDPATALCDPKAYKEYQARRVWEIHNAMYNDFVVRCEPWIMRVDIEDIMEIVRYPSYFELLSNPVYLQSGLDKIYKAADDLLLRNPDMAHNPLAKLVRSGLLNDGQVKQCIAARGYMTDMDSYTFPVPIMRSFALGVRTQYETQIESRSMAKSLAYAEEPLEQSEYFSRRQQLVSQTLRRLHDADCGATTGMYWTVDKDDFKNLIGMNYYDDHGVLRHIREGDKHLIDKTIHIRTLFKCQHPDPQGVCTTCFGQLSFASFYESNLGQDTAVSMLSDMGQRVLSVKHLDGSSVVDNMHVEQSAQRFLRVGRDGSSYVISPDLARASKVELIIDPSNALGFTDIINCRSTTELFPARVSRMLEINVRATIGNIVETRCIDVGLERRRASLSMDVINHIRAKRWTVDANGMYVVDLTGFDHRAKLLNVPMRHFNMGDQAKAVAQLLESKNEMLRERDENTPVTEFIAQLYETVNAKLNVNLGVLIAITYSIMIVSAESNDYSLPKPWTPQGLGIRDLIFRNRSLSPELAFEGQQKAIIDPSRYIRTNTIEHPMDVFIDPRAVLGKCSTMSIREAEIQKLKAGAKRFESLTQAA